MGIMDMLRGGPNPLDVIKNQKNRWYQNVETHKPHDAHDAYSDDDFMRQAFAVSRDHDQYTQALNNGRFMSPSDSSDPNSGALTKEEFETLRKDKKLAQMYVTAGVRNDMADMNAQQWGADWESKVQQDPIRQGLSKKRAMLLQQMMAQQK